MDVERLLSGSIEDNEFIQILNDSGMDAKLKTGEYYFIIGVFVLMILFHQLLMQYGES